MDFNLAAKLGEADGFVRGAGWVNTTTGLPRFWISTRSPAVTQPRTVGVSCFHQPARHQTESTKVRQARCLDETPILVPKKNRFWFTARSAPVTAW